VAGLISGIDAAAEETGVALELLGNRDGDVAAASRRLLQSRPDVLAFAAPPVRHAVLIGEARRLEIPCIGTGTLLPTIGVPAVMEDGEGGARRAVQYLVSKGHKKIGFVSPTFALPWVFQRRLGYMEGLAQAGLDPDEGMVLWLNRHDKPEAANLFMSYLERRRPTAVFLSSWVLGEALARLVKAGRLSVPRDLSVIVFDQHPQMAHWLGCPSAAFVTIPLLEMGRRLAHMARALADGKRIDPLTTLPCALSEGESVAPV
jgi:LacI family transcriptional regulator